MNRNGRESTFIALSMLRENPKEIKEANNQAEP